LFCKEPQSLTTVSTTVSQFPTASTCFLSATTCGRLKSLLSSGYWSLYTRG
jgi:hypothetical protein